MESRVKETMKKREKGYNCAQAVACTYCDLLGFDEKTVFQMIEGFGAGMGCMDGPCGAVSAAVLLAGLKSSDGQLETPASKGKTYQYTKKIVSDFEEKCGSLVCKELKGVATGNAVHSCADCIQDAAAIVENVLFGEENE